MPTIHPASKCTTPIETLFDDTSLGISTGFYFQRNNRNYLITNWHVITGKNPLTGKHLSSMAAEPNRIKIWQHRTDDNFQEYFLPLEQNSSLLWLQHRQYGSRADVVALEIKSDKRFVVYPINGLNCPLPPEFGPIVGKDVFVLGYPFGKLAIRLSCYPIWKRASIATELAINVEGLPMFLVDTATREGMSGSPVVHIAGEFQEFMGVYSGRYGAEDLNDIQLGAGLANIFN